MVFLPFLRKDHRRAVIHDRYKILMILLVVILSLLFSINIQSFYSGLQSYISVGNTNSDVSVGNTLALVLVGDIGALPTPPPAPSGSDIGTNLLKVLSGLILAGIVISTALLSRNMIMTGIVFIVGVVLLAMLNAILAALF
jgi:hypothetical protein